MRKRAKGKIGSFFLANFQKNIIIRDNNKPNGKYFTLFISSGMKVQVIGEVLEVNTTVQKSQSNNNYFTFKIKDKSSPTQWVINNIKCFYMLNDVYKGETLAKQIHKGDLVFVSWTITIQPPTQPLSNQNNNTSTNKNLSPWVFMTIFVEWVQVVHSDVAYKPAEEKELLTETKLPTTPQTIVQQKEIPSEYFQKSADDILDSILNSGWNPLPF